MGQCTVTGAIAIGDAVCVVGFDTTLNRPQVARASVANLRKSGTVLGLVESVDSATVDVCVAGEVAPNAVTSLGTGASRMVVTDFAAATDESQCRLKRIDDTSGGIARSERFVVGTADPNGNVAVQPRHNSDETGFAKVFNVRAYGAMGLGGDDTAAIKAAIAAATAAASGTDALVYFPPGVYGLAEEIRVDASLLELRGGGVVAGGGASHIGTTLKATASMRSVLALLKPDVRLTRLQIDADRKATYGIYVAHAAQSVLDTVLVKNTLSDGAHVAGRQDDGHNANNDFITLIEYSAYKCGTVFSTAPLMPQYDPINVLPVEGTVTCQAYSATLKGTKTNFAALGDISGRLIRLVSGTSSVVLELGEFVGKDPVTNEDLITVAAVPKVSITRADYAVGIGDGWNEEHGPDQSRLHSRGGLARYCAGSGWVCRGSYGPTLEKPHLDGNGFYGVVIGFSSGPFSSTYTSRIINGYWEGNGGAILGAVYAAGGFGLTIDQPMWAGTGPARKVIVGEAHRNVGVYADETGLESWGGQRRVRGAEFTMHEQFSSNGLSRTIETQWSGYTNLNQPPGMVVRLAALPILNANHAGRVEVQMVGTYNVSGAPRVGVRSLSWAYTYTSGAFELTAPAETTPATQSDPAVYVPTLEKTLVGSPAVPYISLMVVANTAVNVRFEGYYRVMMVREP